MFLHIKLAKLPSIWKSGSGRIGKNKSGEDEALVFLLMQTVIIL